MSKRAPTAARSRARSVMRSSAVGPGVFAWVFGATPALVVMLLELAAVSLVIRADAGQDLPLVPALPTILLVIVVAISIAHLRNVRYRLTRRAREANALARATRVLVAGRGEQETLHGILAATMDAVPSLGAAFITCDPAGERFRAAATARGMLGRRANRLVRDWVPIRPRVD